jgi:hypothetical protein
MHLVLRFLTGLHGGAFLLSNKRGTWILIEQEEHRRGKYTPVSILIFYVACLLLLLDINPFVLILFLI